MMKTNMIKKAIAALTIFGIVTTFYFSTNVYAADRIPAGPGVQGKGIIDCNELEEILLGEVTMYGNHLITEKAEYYDTYAEAYAHYEFDIGSYAEFKDVWVPLLGWFTHACTITDRNILYEDGKYVPIYKNDYNNNYYLRYDYE